MVNDVDARLVLTMSEDDAEDGRALAVLMERPGGVGAQPITGPDEGVAWFSLDLNEGDLADATAFIAEFDWIHPGEVLLRVKATSGGPDRFFSYDEVEGSWTWSPRK